MSTKSVKTTECYVCNTEKETKTEFRRDQKVCKTCENDPNITYTKICTECNEEKDSTLFTKNRVKCKECVNSANRESKKIQKCTGCDNDKEKSEFRRNQIVCKECEQDPSVEYEKKCNECHTIKPNGCFRKNRRKCIDCEQEYGRSYGKTTDTRKKWVENNRDRMSELQHRAYEQNKDQIREKERRKYNDDPHARQIKQYRVYLQRIVRGQEKTCDSLSTTREVFIKWLSYQFSEEMSMDNYGISWELDHVIPLDTLKTKQIGATKFDGNMGFVYAWYNIRPVIQYENAKKNKYIPSKDVIEFHLDILLSFVEFYKSIFKIQLGTSFFVYKRWLGHLIKNM
jgi:hypothetical protein